MASIDMERGLAKYGKQMERRLAANDTLVALLEGAREQARRLEERVGALELALVPFAREADSWLESVSDSYHPGMTEPRQSQAFGKAEFSMRDLRRARRLLYGNGGRQ